MARSMAWSGPGVALLLLVMVVAGCEDESAGKHLPADVRAAEAESAAARHKRQANTVYRYEDEAGNLHFVTGRHNIPPKHLTKATTIDGDKLMTFETPSSGSEANGEADSKPSEEVKKPEPEGWIARAATSVAGAWDAVYSWFLPTQPPPTEPSVPAEPEFQGPPDLLVYDYSGKAWYSWCHQISDAQEKQRAALERESQLIGQRRSRGSSRSERYTEYRGGKRYTGMRRIGASRRIEGETLAVHDAGKAADEAVMATARLKKEAMDAGNLPDWALEGRCEGQQAPTPLQWPERHPQYFQRVGVAGH